MGRSLQNGMLVVRFEFFVPFVVRYVPRVLSYNQPFSSGAGERRPPYPSRWTGWGSWRPELQHVAGCAGICTHQRINPKIPLIESSWGS